MAALPGAAAEAAKAKSFEPAAVDLRRRKCRPGVEVAAG